MYGLKQDAILEYNKLVKHLKPHGYSPIPFSFSLWTRTSRPTHFCLCIDDFGVKYFSQEDADHLIESLRVAFKVTVDWKEENYCGLTLKWTYKNGYVDVSMPGYVDKLLKNMIIQNHPNHNLHHMHGLHQNTDKKDNTLKLNLYYLHLMTN